MRWLAALLLLSACSSGGNTPFERLRPFAEDLFADPPAIEDPNPTRAQLDAVPYAMISVAIDDGPRGFVVPVADNGGYLDYVDPSRRGLVMYGGLVTGTHGYGLNLSAVKTATNDPIVTPTPLAEWPEWVDRSWQFPRRDQYGYDITLRCSWTRVAEEEVEIVEIIFDLIRIEEHCVNTTRAVKNTYWVDAATGNIWKSRQWIGPQQKPLTIEVIRPYKAS